MGRRRAGGGRSEGRWLDLALCLLEAKEPARALVAAQRAAALDPSVDEAHSEQVELPPHDAAISLTLGDAYAATGDHARATLHHLQAYLKSTLEPQLRPVGLLEAGRDSEALGLVEQAKWIYRVAWRIQPLAAQAKERLDVLGWEQLSRRRSSARARARGRSPA